MRTHHSLQLRTLQLTLALFLSALISACAGIKLISDYDEATEKALTDLQQSSDDFLMKLYKNTPSPANSFNKQKQFYDDTLVSQRLIE